MRNVDLESWSEFQDALRPFFELRPMIRGRYVFRGQRDSQWPLRSTLDRLLEKHDLQNRDRIAKRLLDQFEQESASLLREKFPTSPDEQELFARHHSLPSKVLDWTRSPYIAAFFAFADQPSDASPLPERCAIWCLDLNIFDETDGTFADAQRSLRLIGDNQATRRIERVFEQQSVFISHERVERSVESMVGDRLWRFSLPRSEAVTALAQLEAMRITSRTLFRSTESAAETATWRTVSTLRRVTS